jgi:hypothetical protein
MHGPKGYALIVLSLRRKADVVDLSTISAF